MKVTSQIPDDLYRKVKAKAAHEGRAVREITEGLYRAYVAVPDAEARIRDGEAWLEQWLPIARGATLVPDGPTARERLEGERGRLEHA
ncbi:MAG: hypothetical protein U0974_02770 [Gemmatimonadales bacterium]|nr:hypothetical protein [Gemmatimonadales bacterium]MDZ4388636.1 hypothetical protein [Gemmatimonadales bacterium]